MEAGDAHTSGKIGEDRRSGRDESPLLPKAWRFSEPQVKNSVLPPNSRVRLEIMDWPQSPSRCVSANATNEDLPAHSDSAYMGITNTNATNVHDPLIPMTSALDSRDDGSCKSEEKRVTSKQWKEWIPITLRPWSAILAILYCVTLVVGLELLNSMPATRQGIPASNKGAVRAVNYLPTALVVLLGIFWKRLTVDLKCIMPWSILSQRWARGRDAIQLNYLDDLELLHIWPSARRCHWALFLGLVGGLLCGALVPMANSLTSVTPSGRIVQRVEIERRQFDFNGTLLESNQTLRLLKSYLGNEPWAGASNVLQTGGNLPAWTAGSFVFAPFELAASQNITVANQTITANTTAITAELECQQLLGNASLNTLVPSVTYDITYHVHNQTNISLYSLDYDPQENRPEPIQLVSYNEVNGALNPPTAWLNTSSLCPASTNDYAYAGSLYCGERILLTVLQPLNRQPTTQFRVTALTCAPRYEAHDARVTVNASSGIVTEYYVDHQSAIALDIGLPTEAVIGYLNNPRHPDTIMGLAEDKQEKQAQDNIFLAGGGNLLPPYYTASSGSDPFGTVLLDLQLRPIDAYFESPALLEADATRVFATTMSQIIKSFAVGNRTTALTGVSETLEPLVQIQPTILRVLEASLLILIIIIACCAWPLRPRSVLSEDPSSLYMIARLVSHNSDLDGAFKIDGNSKNQLWRNSHFRLRRKGELDVSLDFAPAGSTVHADGTVRNDTYEPLQLRTWARFSMGSLLALFIVVLGILYQYGKVDGYLATRKTTQIAWSFVPTAVLVLVGYAISGALSAVQGIAPFTIMRSRSVDGRLISRFSPRHRSELTLPYHASLKKVYFPVLLASLIALIYPVIKIVAADLYETFEAPRIQNCNAQVAPLNFNFSDLVNINGTYQMRLQNTAAIRTDWVQLPELGTQSQPNVIRNIIFPEDISLGCQDKEQGSSATARLEALAIDLQCQLLDGDDFVIKVNKTEQEVPGGSLADSFDFQVFCRTPDCERQMQYQFPGAALAGRLTNWTFTRYDPYSDNTRSFYGFAANAHSSPLVQMMIVDWSSISGPVRNISDVTFDGNWVEARPGMFNVSLPTARGLSCTPDVRMVEVQATLERKVKAGLNGQVEVLPWAVTEFDNSSIQGTQQIDVSNPGMWQKMFPSGSLDHSYQSITTHDASNYNVTNWSGLNDDEIQPVSGIASNFFELLASYEQSNGRNVSVLLDVAELAKATSALYGIYNAELLSHFRQNTSLSRRDSGVPAQLTTSQERVRPNPRTTFAVIGMLLAVLIFLIIIFATTRSKRVLRDKPGTIAAQLSLFAGSRLVQRLRSEDGGSVWDEKFSLGWWHVYDASVADGRGIRWGVDVGVLDEDLQREISAPEEKLKTKRDRRSSFMANVLGGARAPWRSKTDVKKEASSQAYHLM